MRADEFVSEGFLDNLKARFSASGRANAAAQKEFQSKIDNAFKATLPKWSFRLAQIKKNPAVAGNPDAIKTELVNWANSWLQLPAEFGAGATTVPEPRISNINDNAVMQNYLKDRIAEFLEKRDRARTTGVPGGSGSSEMELADEIPVDGSKLLIKGQGSYEVSGGQWKDPRGNPIDDNVKIDKLSSLYAQSIKAKQDAAPKGAIAAPQVLSTIPHNVIFRYQNDDFYKNASGEWEGRKKKNKNLARQFQEYFNDLETKVTVPESKQHLSESGNVFKDANGVPVTRRIKQAEIMPTVQFLERVTGLDFTTDIDESDGLPKRWLGSTGRKLDSGDLDLAVDVTKTSKEQLEQTLKSWCQKQGLDSRQHVKKSGTSVHFNAPILGDPENGTVQTDFMFGEPNWMHFSMQGGRQKHILMASIAKYLGLKWSYANGLSSRMTEQPISGARSPGRIAQILLGPAGRPEDLKSVETIIKKIKNNPEYESMVADARTTLGNEGYQLPESMHTSTRKLTKQ